MSKHVVILWESFADNKINEVKIVNSPAQAKRLANKFRATRRRRADVISVK